MMKRNCCLSLVALVLFAQVTKGEVPYAKPLDTAVRMSASFAELRANHFHSGIDMSTSGATGINVFAAEEGYVSRIKVSAFGYGRALYIDHPDGRTTVYAHLNQYAPKIEAYVRAEQLKRKSFEVDLYPSSDALPVERGEVVAFSGNTGSSGGPHLHFEVRDTKSERPLNPLAYLAAVDDNMAPTIYGAKLYALGDETQVSGRIADKYYARADIAGKTIDVVGHVGIGLHCTDFFTSDGRPCGVVEIRLYDGNELIFNSVLDTLSFDKTRFINSYIDYAEWQSNKRFVQKSFVEPGNQLDNYRVAKEMNVADGETHQMRYEVFDFAGNKSVMSFTLRGKASAQKPAVAEHKGYEVDWRRTWAIDTMGISVIVPRESFYKNEWLEIAAKPSEQLRQTVWTIGSGKTPVHKEITVALPVPEHLRSIDPKKVIVVQVDAKNRLSSLATSSEDTMVVAKPRTLGRFAVACDTIAPTVVSRNTRSNLVGTNFVMVGLTDNLSGIAKYDCYIDGEWKIFEYDYKKTMLKARVESLELEKGRHTVEAVVSDACGNETRFEWSFNVL